MYLHKHHPYKRCVHHSSLGESTTWSLINQMQPPNLRVESNYNRVTDRACLAKMAGYWSSSFFYVYRKRCKKGGHYPAISNKQLKCGIIKRTQFYLCDKPGNHERDKIAPSCCTAANHSASSCILSAHRAKRIINTVILIHCERDMLVY